MSLFSFYCHFHMAIGWGRAHRDATICTNIHIHLFWWWHSWILLQAVEQINAVCRILYFQYPRAVVLRRIMWRDIIHCCYYFIAHCPLLLFSNNLNNSIERILCYNFNECPFCRMHFMWLPLDTMSNEFLCSIHDQLIDRRAILLK